MNKEGVQPEDTQPVSTQQLERAPSQRAHSQRTRSQMAHGEAVTWRACAKMKGQLLRLPSEEPPQRSHPQKGYPKTQEVGCGEGVDLSLVGLRLKGEPQ